MSTSEKLASQFLKPALVSVSGYLLAKGLGEEGVVRVLGSVDLRLPVFYALLCAGGSFSAEVLKNWVLPYVPGNSSRDAKSEALLISPVLNGVVCAGGMYLGSGLSEGLMTPFVIGAGSEVSGQYSYSVISPYVV